MLEQENGGPKKLPAILVGWDAEAQAIQVRFDSQEFLTWGFVRAVLDMACRHAEMQERLGLAQAAQQAQAEAARDEMLRRQLRGGR